MKLTASPIKKIALQRHIECLHPPSLKVNSVIEKLKSYGADIFVVVAYGRLLTQEILDIPKMLCMNVHGSLLPKYRGAAPVNWAILNGDKETGVTVQKMALASMRRDHSPGKDNRSMTMRMPGNCASGMALAGAELLVKV